MQLKILQISQENTCVEIPTQVFSAISETQQI